MQAEGGIQGDKPSLPDIYICHRWSDNGDENLTAVNTEENGIRIT